MDIKDLSTATLSKFQEYGWLDSFQDLYHLDMHREEIIRLEGFGVKSYENLWASIEASRHTTFERYLVAMDIPLVGRTISRSLGQQFHGSLDDFEQAATGTYDFTQLEDIGTIINDNIHTWFSDMDNLKLWKELQKEMTFEERTEETMNVEQSEQNPFAGRTIVATGKLMNYTRDGIQAKILSLGAKAGSSVSKNTDYLICGDKAGSKLAKAQSLGVRILSEYEFLSMIDEA
jgi:DNA ligase (NAD+)